MSDKLTHLDEHGRADMVDVGDKPDTDRIAIAEGAIYVQPATLRLIQAGNMKKGDVLTIARIAGIMGAKKTSELIPLCHPVPITKIGVDLSIDESANAIRIRAQARTLGKTGIEMEVLTAVSIAALTIYDMAKAVDRSMTIGDIRLLEKRGGVHGDYIAEDTQNGD
ncbi:MAG: cyclic pyranopterin monophosphate synthase MoaC [Phototrophicaceae bacterium]